MNNHLEKIKPFKFEDTLCVTINQFAQLEDVTRRTVHAWIEKGAINYSGLMDGQTEKKFIHISSLSAKGLKGLDI